MTVTCRKPNQMNVKKETLNFLIFKFPYCLGYQGWNGTLLWLWEKRANNSWENITKLLLPGEKDGILRQALTRLYNKYKLTPIIQMSHFYPTFSWASTWYDICMHLSTFCCPLGELRYTWMYSVTNLFPCASLAPGCQTYILRAGGCVPCTLMMLLLMLLVFSP